MKILVRLFLIILVMFSYSQADEKFFEDLYENEVKKYEYYITSREKWINNYKVLIKLPISRISSWRKASFLKQMKKLQAEKEEYQKEVKLLKKLFVTNKKALYKELKESVIKESSSLMIRYQNQVKHSEEIGITSLSKRFAILVKKNKLKKNEVSTAYDTYLKSLKIKKISSKVLNTSKNNKLKVSTANMSKNTSKVSLKSSNLKTTVKTNNISVSNKAKASVGSISIGKAEK